MQKIRRTQLFGLSVTICLLILAFSSWGDPQNVQARPLAAGVSVDGMVLNQVTQTGAAGIDVKLYYGSFGGSPQYSTTSDANGFFHFADIPAGPYIIIVFPPSGYIGRGFSITIGTSNISNILLSIVKDIPLLSPPDHSFVEIPHPWLCWEGMTQADSYWIQINRKSDWLLINNPRIYKSACYLAQGPFENGVEYSWQVANALNIQGAEIGSTGSAFRFTYKTTPVIQAINQAGITSLTSWDTTIKFDFPPGSLDGAGTITYQRKFQAPSAYPMAAIGKTYELSSTASLITNATYTVTITYSDTDVLGINQGTLALYAWDSGLGQWIKEPSSQLDAANHTITATPNHLSTWSVIGVANWTFLPSIRK